MPSNVGYVEAGLRSGTTQAQIARELGISRERVRQIVAEYGMNDKKLKTKRLRARGKRVIADRNRLKRRAFREVVIKCRDSGWPWKRVAAELGFSDWKIAQHLYRYWTGC